MPAYKLVKTDENGRIIMGEELRVQLRSENFNSTVPVLPPYYNYELCDGRYEGEPFLEYMARRAVWVQEIFIPWQENLQTRANMVKAYGDELRAQGFELAIADKDWNWRIVSPEEPRFNGKHWAFASQILGLNPPYQPAASATYFISMRFLAL